MGLPQQTDGPDEGTAGGRGGPRIAVAGAGAIGAFLGGRLTLAGRRVTLVDGWREHVLTMQRDGLEINDDTGRELARVKAVHLAELKDSRVQADIVLLAVKSFDTESMLKALKPLLKPGVLVVSCQNGLNEETIAAVVGREAVLGCVINMGARLDGPGRVTRLGRGGLLVVGQLDGATAKAEILAQILKPCARTEVTANLAGHRWAKLAVNCMGNAFLAVTGLSGLELHQSAPARRLMREAVAETVRVAAALGVRVEPILGIDPELWALGETGTGNEIDRALSARGRALGGRRSSTAQDLAAGRPVEIDYLNGRVVAQARLLGLSSPVNQALADLAGRVAQGRLQADPANIDLILRGMQPEASPEGMPKKGTARGTGA